MSRKLSVDDDFEETGPTMLPELDNAFRPLVRILERSAIVHLLGMIAGFVAFAVVCYTAIQISEDLSDRQEERIARKDERKERAWSRLRDPVGGETGKGDQLSVLLENEVDVRQIDLSCSAVGRWMADECKSSPVFSRVRFPNGIGLVEDGLPAMISLPLPVEVFGYSTLRQSNVSAYSIKMEGFSNARFEQVDAAATRFNGQTDKFFIRSSDLSFSTFHTVGTYLSIIDSNVSGAIFPDTFEFSTPSKYIVELFADKTPRGIFGNKNWAWADAPPAAIRNGDLIPMSRDNLSRIRLCDPETRMGSDGDVVTKDGFMIFRKNFTGRSRNGFLLEANRSKGQLEERRTWRLCKELNIDQARALSPLYPPPVSGE